MNEEQLFNYIEDYYDKMKYLIRNTERSITSNIEKVNVTLKELESSFQRLKNTSPSID